MAFMKNLFPVLLLSLYLAPDARAYQCHGCKMGVKELFTQFTYRSQLSDKVSSLRRMPFDMTDYVAQGLTKHNGNLFLSYYYKDKKGKNHRNESSMVVEYNFDKLKVNKIWYLTKDNLPYTDHVGGLVVINGNFVVTHGSKFYVFSPGQGGAANFVKEISPDFGNIPKNNGFSFASITPDHRNVPILWTGQFKEKAQASDILGYEITGDGFATKPTYQLQVPEATFRAQGVALLSATPTKYVFALARSYGDKPSKLSRLIYSMTGTTGKLDSTKVVFTGPAGMENIHPTTDGVWSVSESGANYFQKRKKKPWGDYFPFIFRLKKKKLY